LGQAPGICVGYCWSAAGMARGVIHAGRRARPSLRCSARHALQRRRTPRRSRRAPARERDLGRSEIFLGAMKLGGPGDRDDPRPPRQDPCKRHLRGSRTLAPGDVLDRLNHRLVGLPVFGVQPRIVRSIVVAAKPCRPSRVPSVRFSSLEQRSSKAWVIYHPPRQTGARFSRNASIPSAASCACIFSAMTLPAWA